MHFNYKLRDKIEFPSIPCAIKPYLTHQDEMSQAEGIMRRRNRIIMPTSMRKEMKSRIHEGHLGPRHRKV
jgi:hypothetical protein